MEITAEEYEWPIIGIDLGTTNSCVAIWRNDRVEVIANEDGSRTTPSWVVFTDSDRLIGEAAKKQSSIHFPNAVFDAKRLMGRRFSDESVQKDKQLWPFKVMSGIGDKPLIIVSYRGEEKRFIPEEISSMVLRKMRDIAEAFLGTSVENAVVAVPAYFNNSQRQATKDAGVIAGLNIVRIFNEPTAAALAYGLQLKARGSDGPAKNVLIFDLGGGNFDVSLVAIKNSEFTVKAISGDTHLGGGDFDNRLVSYLVDEFKRKHKRDISGNPKAIGKLRSASERAKRLLSSTFETTITVDGLCESIDFSLSLTRARFEALNKDLFKICIKVVENCLEEAHMEKEEVDDVVLIGGSTRIPKVRELLQQFFGRKEGCQSINPDEAVAYGAAIYASALAGVSMHENIVVADVTPLSLGIRDVTGAMDIVLPRYTTLPSKKNQFFYTTVDNQSSSRFDVYEGERARAEDNTLLGTFSLHHLPLAPKGKIKFDVCFDIGVDGILTVSAEETTTKSRTKITIVKQGLTSTELEKLIKDAENYKALDEENQKRVKARNALETYVNDLVDEIDSYWMIDTGSKEEKIKNMVDETLEWLKYSDNAEAYLFDNKLEELTSLYKECS